MSNSRGLHAVLYYTVITSHIYIYVYIKFSFTIPSLKCIFLSEIELEFLRLAVIKTKQNITCWCKYETILTCWLFMNM